MALMNRRQLGAGIGNPTPQPVPDGNEYTTAGGAAAGQWVGSGEVAPWNALGPYGGAGLVPAGPQQLAQGSPDFAVSLPDSLYQSRPLYGGVRTLSAYAEYTEGPPNLGGFTLMAHRPPLALLEGVRMEATPFIQDASWRDAPSVVDLCQRTPTELS
jgi:hypothetical protein